MNDQSIIKIGEGGYGDAFLLIKYKPPLVMKVVDEIQNLEKQEAEMRILKSLVHENIVRFKDQPLDFVYAGPGFPIFMEFCGEGSLRKVITDVILSYSMASVVKWGREIFIVLQYLQSKRIVHRDLKPDNIFLTEDFDLKVGDFGVFEKFDSNNVNGVKRVGTLCYMAPELLLDQELTEEQFYKCDIYAAGLVLWEMIMRRDWNKANGYMEFPSVTSADVARLFELIKNCSSANTNINDRYDVEDALNQLEIIKKSFSSLIAKPERKRHQTFLLDVEGLCLNTAGPDSNFIVPDIPRFTSKTQLTQKQPIEIQNRNSDLRFHDLFNQWIAKIERETDFENITVKTGVLNDINEIQSIQFWALPPDVSDVNEIREAFCDRFFESAQLDQISLDDKRKLFAEMQEIYKELSQESYLSFFFPSNPKAYVAEKRGDPRLHHFANILTFDFALQDFSFRFALHVLWQCKTLTFSWVELLELLDLAIHNIEEVDQIMTRRQRRPFQYLNGSRMPFFNDHLSGLAFTKDLTEFREGPSENQKKRIEIDDVIDLEVIRRALHTQKDLVLKFTKFERKIGSNTMTRLQNYIGSSRTSKLFVNGEINPLNQLNHPVTVFQLIIKTLSYRIKSRFPGYIYFWNIMPMRREEPKCHCLTRCELKDFPENSPFHQIGLRYFDCQVLKGKKMNSLRLTDLYDLEQQIIDKVNLEETASPCPRFQRFPGIAWDLRTWYMLSRSCDCEPSCEVKEYPENAPEQFYYSSCPKMNQREFLETHSLFERAFRLLHDWEKLSIHQFTTRYLIEKLLSEISKKKSPSFGFFFLWVKDKEPLKDPLLNPCDHQAPKVRSGLLIALDQSVDNSFLNKEFNLEIGCNDCLKEYIGLTYVYLAELGILLQIMQRFLRGWLDEFTYSLDDVDESEYCKAMRTAIENFWKTRELL